MLYLTGYTEAEADGWGRVFLGLAESQLNTDADTWGKVELTDGTWAVPYDEQRAALVVIPNDLKTRLAARISEGRLRSREELLEDGLLLPPTETTFP